MARLTQVIICTSSVSNIRTIKSPFENAAQTQLSAPRYCVAMTSPSASKSAVNTSSPPFTSKADILPPSTTEYTVASPACKAMRLQTKANLRWGFVYGVHWWKDGREKGRGGGSGYGGRVLERGEGRGTERVKQGRGRGGGVLENKQRHRAGHRSNRCRAGSQ